MSQSITTDFEDKNSKSPKTGFKKWIQRNMYRWHRIIGIIALVPTIFWTASGVMHPFMSHWFKTKIANEFYKAETTKQDEVKLTAGQALTQNQITSFKNIRFVKFNQKSYYQVKNAKGNLLYFNTIDGKPLPNGDILFAEQIARFMLADSTSKIKSIEKLTEFTEEYPYVNRILPAYKVSFDRPDKMDLYVETEQSRFIVFNDAKRKVFIKIFDIFHNWDFLNAISNNTIRIIVMMIFLTIIIASAVGGLVIYGFMWGKFKPTKKENQVSIFRKYHRSIGLWTSFVTFTFAFSGIYHATRKFTPDERLKYVSEPIMQTKAIAQDSLVNLKGVSNISLVKMNEQIYWQLIKKNWETKETSFEYLTVNEHKPLKDGFKVYAEYLANQFSNREAKGGEECCEMMDNKSSMSLSDADLKEVKIINKFAGEYGFVNKRLPVIKLAYNTPENTTFYIEPATNRLAAKVTDADRREGFSFAFLHKYNGLESLGKDIRDGVMTLAAFGVLVVSIFGLAIFIKTK